MTNVQQPEMRRNEHNPTVTDSKEPGPSGFPRNRGKSQGDRGRTVPKGQASPYGPTGRQRADDESKPRG